MHLDELSDARRELWRGLTDERAQLLLCRVHHVEAQRERLRPP